GLFRSRRRRLRRRVHVDFFDRHPADRGEPAPLRCRRMPRLSLQQILCDALAFPDQLDVVILHPHVIKRAENAVHLTVSADRPFSVPEGGRNVEGPAILVHRLYPTRGTNDDALLAEPVEQPSAVADLLGYQRDCIHLNTPSALWLTASNIAFASASGLV